LEEGSHLGLGADLALVHLFGRELGLGVDLPRQEVLAQKPEAVVLLGLRFFSATHNGFVLNLANRKVKQILSKDIFTFKQWIKSQR
jgi:hypothetical protein